MDKRKLAQWWCLLNGQQWPEDLAKPKVRGHEDDLTRGAFMIVDALASKEGLELWRRRCDLDLDPATGMKLADVADAGVKGRHVAARRQ